MKFATSITSISLLLSICHNAAGQKLSMRKLAVTEISFDTIRTKTALIAKSTVKFGDKLFYFYNSFNYSKTYLFDMRMHKGLKLTYKNKSIKTFYSIKKSFKDRCYDSFSVFRGNSIDNDSGFSCLYSSGLYKNQKIEYILENGYSYGCNGSSCNSGSILAIKLVDNIIYKSYIFWNR